LDIANADTPRQPARRKPGIRLFSARGLLPPELDLQLGDLVFQVVNIPRSILVSLPTRQPMNERTLPQPGLRREYFANRMMPLILYSWSRRAAFRHTIENNHQYQGFIHRHQRKF
jgi:hypothetical protein